jgi:hypothetical protein
VHLSHLDRTRRSRLCRAAGRDRDHQPGNDRLQRAGAVHGVVLVARPAAGRRGDLLKPDLIAPGQDILAAVAPPGNSGKSFDLYSGTSMSSPHVAGLAALMKEKYPSWSPMAIKSALMTTGMTCSTAARPPRTPTRC